MHTLRFCTAGSVDDGKSTFVGRLLHDTKSILTDQLDSIQRSSATRGFDGLDLSLLVDGLRAEREQGITIDVAYRYFATAHRNFILADTPGHVQYTRNTVTGVSTSDVVVLLVDARKGVIEQTRTHLSVAALLGVQTVILAVNKIDLVDYNQAIFDTIDADFRSIATQLGITYPYAVPISALNGDNVVETSPNLPWYTGPTILELLETIDVKAEESDFRFPIQYVIRSTDYRGYAGSIASGSIQVGQEVATPSGTTTITSIDTSDGPVNSASRGDAVTLRLADELDLSRGDLVAINPPQSTNQLSATIVGLSATGIAAGQVVELRYGTATVKARLADDIAHNAIVPTTVALQAALPVEPYAGRGAVGAFLVIHPVTGDTLAAGLVT